MAELQPIGRPGLYPYMSEMVESVPKPAELQDEEIVRRVLDGDTGMYEILMRRYNQRLYRVCRSILRDDAEAEDVMQDAYVRAYTHLGQFEGRAKFSTWLTRIAVYEALARSEKSKRFTALDDEGESKMTAKDVTAPSGPEDSASHSEMKRILEDAISRLPEAYRTVFMLRMVEDASTEEAAEVLGLTKENVKIRVLRARAMLRRDLAERIGMTSADAFPFHATRCDRVVNAVMKRILQD